MNVLIVFFDALTIFMAITFAFLIAQMVKYDFNTIEAGFIIIISSIIISVAGSVPLNHFLFNEPLYEWQTILRHSGFFFGGMNSIFHFFKRFVSREDELDEDDETLDEVPERFSNTKTFNDSWKGRW